MILHEPPSPDHGYDQPQVELDHDAANAAHLGLKRVLDLGTDRLGITEDQYDALLAVCDDLGSWCLEFT